MFERFDGQAIGFVHDDEGTGDAGGVEGHGVQRAGGDRQPRIAHFSQAAAQPLIDQFGCVADRDRVEDRPTPRDLLAE